MTGISFIVYNHPALTCAFIAPGIYHGTLNFDPNSDDHIDSTQLHPYPTFSNGVAPGASPSAAEVPISISLTEFHFLLLYADRIVGISTLNGKQTYEDVIPLVCHAIRCRLHCY
jgi:vacuolar protein sorting-associated protein 18